MKNARSIKDEASAPGTGAQVVAPSGYPTKYATVTADVLARAAAGLSSPNKDESPRLAGAEGFRDQDKADSPDCADHLTGDQAGATYSERFAALAARLAQAGWLLTRNDAVSATFTASRWCRSTAELRDLAAVEAFAGRVGAPS